MTQPDSKYTLAEIITRVGRLLTRADDAGATPAEAALCREKAEKLMREWRIAEENLLATDHTAISPIHRNVFICDVNNEFFLELQMMMRYICHHSEIREYARWGRVDGKHGLWVTLVGFEVDIRMAEWIWSSARLAFGNHLEPVRDDTLSEQVNVYRMRRAGMLRKDVAMLMWGQNTPALRTKAQRFYLKECHARGEEPQLEGLGTDAKAFRAAYARSFTERIERRLREARDAANSSGGVVTLAGRADKVREALYELFPFLRPSKAVAVVDTPAVNFKSKGPTKAQLRRAMRMYYSDAAIAGAEEGERAANDVEISRPDPTLRIED